MDWTSMWSAVARYFADWSVTGDLSPYIVIGAIALLARYRVGSIGLGVRNDFAVCARSRQPWRVAWFLFRLAAPVTMFFCALAAVAVALSDGTLAGNLFGTVFLGVATLGAFRVVFMARGLDGLRLADVFRARSTRTRRVGAWMAFAGLAYTGVALAGAPLFVAASSVGLMRDADDRRHLFAQLARPLAAVCGVSLEQVAELGMRQADDGTVTIGPLPPSALQRLDGRMQQTALQALPDWEVVEATPQQLVIRPVTVGTLQARETQRDSGGLVVSAGTGAAPHPALTDETDGQAGARRGNDLMGAPVVLDSWEV